MSGALTARGFARERCFATHLRVERVSRHDRSISAPSAVSWNRAVFSLNSSRFVALHPPFRIPGLRSRQSSRRRRAGVRPASRRPPDARLAPRRRGHSGDPHRPTPPSQGEGALMRTPILVTAPHRLRGRCIFDTLRADARLLARRWSCPSTEATPLRKSAPGEGSELLDTFRDAVPPTRGHTQAPLKSYAPPGAERGPVRVERAASTGAKAAKAPGRGPPRPSRRDPKRRRRSCR